MKNLFLTMAVAVALCIGSSAVATTFENQTAYDLQVSRRMQSAYPLSAAGRQSVLNGIVLRSTMDFGMAGVPDNLAIKVGEFNRGGGALATVSGVPPLLRFNLTEIKKYFSKIEKLTLKQNGYAATNNLEFILSVVGELRRNAILGDLESFCMGWNCTVKANNSNPNYRELIVNWKWDASFNR